MPRRSFPGEFRQLFGMGCARNWRLGKEQLDSRQYVEKESEKHLSIGGSGTYPTLADLENLRNFGLYLDIIRLSQDYKVEKISQKMVSQSCFISKHTSHHPRA